MHKGLEMDQIHAPRDVEIDLWSIAKNLSVHAYWIGIPAVAAVVIAGIGRCVRPAQFKASAPVEPELNFHINNKTKRNRTYWHHSSHTSDYECCILCVNGKTS